MKLHTVNEFIMAICTAIQNKDEPAIYQCDRAVADWMVDTETRTAINELLDTAYDASSNW